jgi:ferredoxin--NADP+ reductase
MFKILKKEQLSPDVFRFKIEARDQGRNAKPGQFLILRTHEGGERIPLTIAEHDAGSVTIVVQRIGASTRILCDMAEGDAISDVLAPLGTPSHLGKFGTVALVGGGVGIAVIWPLVKPLKALGNKVVAIIGARNEGLLIYRRELEAACDQVLVTTDDGSAGRKGFVSDALKDLCAAEPVAHVFEAGPPLMMRAVAEATRPLGVATTASLNSLMLDGTGMCGMCRVSVGSETKFTCVDGPDFDAHRVDFNELITRLAGFKDLEQVAVQQCARHLSPSPSKP